MARRTKERVESRMPQTSNGNGTTVPTGPLVAKATATQGVIEITNRDRLLFQLWGEVKPDQMSNILRQALIGNLVWQERLFQKMQDEWPRLQKNMMSLKRDVANLDWGIKEHTEKGAKASQIAQDKVELVERALFGMVGDPTLDQSDFSGMIYDIVDAIACGFSVSEIYWTERDGEIVPQCTRKIPARYYGYSLMPEMPDQLMLNPKGNLSFTWTDLQHFPENKFLIGVHKGYAGHPTVSAMMRCLTPYYFAHVYGLKWFMTFCQVFGTPMRIAEYTPGDVTTFNSLCTMLEQMGNANWGVFPSGSKVELVESKATNGTMQPQRVLAQDADEQCDIMILGQTLTSSVRSESGANRALGQVHADTERKDLNGVADFVKTVINRQLIPYIVLLNYGETSECPTIEGATEEATDELALAQRDLILFDQMGLPVAKDFLYPRHSVPEPSDDDDLYTPPVVGPDPKFNGIPTSPVPPPLPAGAVEPKGSVAKNPDGPLTKIQKANASEFMIQPSMQMAAAAKRGLAARQQHGRGGSLTAVTRARDISQRRNLSINHIKRMQMYFDTHPEDAQADPTSAGGIAHQLHGGNAGKAWVAEMLKKNQG
jgi:phage gp29-like protein